MTYRFNYICSSIYVYFYHCDYKTRALTDLVVFQQLTHIWSYQSMTGAHPRFQSEDLLAPMHTAGFEPIRPISIPCIQGRKDTLVCNQ